MGLVSVIFFGVSQKMFCQPRTEIVLRIKAWAKQDKPVLSFAQHSSKSNAHISIDRNFKVSALHCTYFDKYKFQNVKNWI